MIFVGLLLSCSQHYFDRPQPIDSKNIYAFPEAFRGVWTDGSDSLIVGKFYFANIEYKKISIPYSTRDTTQYAIFNDNKAYPYDSIQQRIIGIGYPYEIRNDSIYYTTREILEAQLGRKAVLRSVGEQFVLNVKNDNQWWELFLMGVTNQEKILIRYPNNEQLAELGITPIFTNDEEDFYEVKWRAKEMDQLIGKNIFADTLLFLDQQNLK
ncbi:MAG: hypothetical protein ABJF04_01030 [Reichenbachiella sp.]|uniref:hypothetical protein n=1 Tax=Reichenbachiella sp. TaxID=2184521 RepID=UPI003265E27B